MGGKKEGGLGLGKGKRSEKGRKRKWREKGKRNEKGEREWEQGVWKEGGSSEGKDCLFPLSVLYNVQYITIAGLQPLLSNITFNWYLSLRIWLKLNCQLLYLVNYVLPLHTLYTVKCDFYLFSVTCSFL